MKSSMSDTPVIRRRNSKSLRRRDGLLRHAHNFTSQSGEDGILARLFELLPAPKEKIRRWCVDVGAWDGVHLSNTHTLLVRQGWDGVLIEADEERFADLKRLHAPLGNVCINVAVSCVEKSPRSLMRLLEDHAPNLPRELDFLSIDVDGTDYWLLQDVLSSGMLHPTVICVEFNPTMPNDLVYIPARTDHVRHGASLAALVELAEQHSYILVETTLYNAFFVPQHLYDKYLAQEVPDTSIEALHETTMGTSLYQLYDGTLKLWGCKRMLWHRMSIEEEAIQILPPEARAFPFAPEVQSGTSDSQALKSAAIDMSPYCTNREFTNTSQQRRECVKALWSQLEADGFALVRGTGMTRQECQSALSMTKAFLQDADESVRRSCLTKDRARRGYSPMCTENFASLIGEDGPNDLVRKFRIGPTVAVSQQSSSSPLLRPNVWPVGWDQQESFRAVVSNYYEAASRAAHAIVRAICDGLRTKYQKLEDSVRVLSLENGEATHTSILTLLGYRPGTRHKRKEKPPLVAPHTDVGVITFLLFDNGGCATLQRADRSEEGSWVDVRLSDTVKDDPVFVVNIGDCLSELSDGALPSTLHRVVPQTTNSTPRNCLALFVGLEPTTELSMPNGDTLVYEEWRKQRIARAQAVLKSLPRNN